MTPDLSDQRPLTGMGRHLVLERTVDAIANGFCPAMQAADDVELVGEGERRPGIGLVLEAAKFDALADIEGRAAWPAQHINVMWSVPSKSQPHRCRVEEIAHAPRP